MDEIDKRLVNLLQVRFPIEREPFDTLGGLLGISGEQVISRIEGLKDKGIVRLISPVFDARSLGYQITLVAANVPENRLDMAGETLSGHPGIGHCYRRDHGINLWATLAIPPRYLH